MPKPTYATCRNCGRHRDEAGILTHSRLCIDCAHAIEQAHNDQLKAHSGPWFTNWRRGLAASVGAVLLDDVIPKG